MLETITRNLEGVRERSSAHWLRRVLLSIGDTVSSVALNSAGLVISAGGAVTAKIGATDFYALVNGMLVKIAAGTAMPSLVGVNISAGAFNVVCFFVDVNGTVTALAGTQATTLLGVTFPQFPYKKTLIGMLVITYASPFVGGTTPLDTATTVYLSPIGAVDATILP